MIPYWYFPIIDSPFLFNIDGVGTLIIHVGLEQYVVLNRGYMYVYQQGKDYQIIYQGKGYESTLLFS